MADQILPVVFERPPLSLPIAEAARELRLSRQAFERIVKEGRIRCHTMGPGGDRRVSYSELVRFIESRESEGMGR